LKDKIWGCSLIGIEEEEEEEEQEQEQEDYLAVL